MARRMRYLPAPDSIKAGTSLDDYAAADRRL
jgi:hypothetical protein